MIYILRETAELKYDEEHKVQQRTKSTKNTAKCIVTFKLYFVQNRKIFGTPKREYGVRIQWSIFFHFQKELIVSGQEVT